MNDDDFLLDDTEVDTTIEAEGIEEVEQVESEQVEENTIDTTEESQEQVQEPFLRVKYNKEERGLTQDEAIMLSQKGLNYDKLQEKLQQMENNPGLNYLNELAQRSNTDIESLVNYWREQEQQQQLNQLVQNNIPEEYAREIIENRKFREQLESQQRENQQKEAQNQEFKQFFETFPDVRPEDIPPAVWENSENGIPLKYAYMEHEMAKLRNDIKVLKQNQTNKAKAPGLGATAYGSHDATVSDPFLEGFNSI